MFLPPEDRADLLGTSEASGTPGITPGTIISHSPGEIIFTVSPGNFDYRSLDNYEYDLSSFSLFETEESSIIARKAPFYIRKGWFDTVDENFDFSIKDLENTEDIYLNTAIGQSQGILTITLNGKTIYSAEAKNAISNLELMKNDLREGLNTLSFTVSNVALAFWTTNRIDIKEVVISAKIIDKSRSESELTFYISPDEGKEIEKSVLKFYPDCESGDEGLLYVKLNDRKVFKGVPDCKILNAITLSPTSLNIGKNSLSFKSEGGNYLIDQIKIKNELEKSVQPTYYFDLDEELFYTKTELTKECGALDGYCPEDCREDDDKDCCFEEYTNGFWCDVPTEHRDDRCVGKVESTDCNRCSSGYEDENGRIADACEDICGDDKDGRCPVGCNENYDKDCCFNQAGDQYWCEDLPITGVDFTCVDAVTKDSCKFCTTDYDGEENNPSCDYSEDTNKKDELKTGTHIEIEFKFTEKGNEKELIFYINGHETGFKTRDDVYTKRIDQYLEPRSNSLRLIPKSDLDIRDITIQIED